MDNTPFWIYLIFGAAMLAGLILDLGLISKKDTIVTFRKAMFQTLLWVSLALGFFVFLLVKKDEKTALEYLSAYIMEWSLSIDNIFVFIIIFSSFKIKEKFYGRVLLIGILMAIVFRFVFISVGVALVDQFHWILYIFGLFLLYTGYKMFTINEEEEFDPKTSSVYRLMNRLLPLAPHDGDGKYVVRENGKPLYTTLFVVVVLLAAIDLVFALDSIPAVIGISKDKLVIYTSNIFAVLGLRSLFFILRTAVSKFDYLQQGIAVVLMFIGTKMLLEKWISARFQNEMTQVLISLGVILGCIFFSILYSIYHRKKGVPKDN